MKRNVLFGVVHHLSHNRCQFVKGLFEVEEHFFYFKTTSLLVFNAKREEPWHLQTGDIIAFDALFTPDQEPTDCRIFDEIPGVKQTRIYELIAIIDRPLLPLPKNLLDEKHQSFDLIEAVKSQSIERVRTLLDQGADANSQDENDTSALLHAVGPTGKGNQEIAEVLILFGADPNGENKGGVSAFTFAKDRGFGNFQKLFQKADLHLATLSWVKKLRGEPIEDVEEDKS